MKKRSLYPAILLVLLLLTISGQASAYEVPALPEGNMIVNPWFRSGDLASLNGWQTSSTGAGNWGVSQKSGNPSPDLVVSGKCGNQPEYCGTSARWANNGPSGVTYPGVDVLIYQVVPADPADRRLSYFMYWVNHKIEIGEVTIYGGDSQTGPWVPVWTPITISQNVNPGSCCTPGHNGVPWFETPELGTTLEAGFPFYKVEIHARYGPSDTDQGDVGMKVTGIFFSTENTSDPASLSTSVVVFNPTAGPTSTSTPASQASPLPSATATAGLYPPPATNTPGGYPPPASSTVGAPTNTPRPTRTPTTGPTEAPGEQPGLPG